MDSDDSQADLFANTQVVTRNKHVTEERPDQWADKNFEYPMLILFQWGGQTSPFILMSLLQLDPRDIDGSWLTGILSPASRRKHRNVRFFSDYKVSIFGKVQKRKFHYFHYFIFLLLF